MKFCKIFTVDNDQEQVLVQMVGQNEEDETFGLSFTTDYDGGRATITAGFKTEDECIKQFDAYTQEGAQEFRDNTRSMFEEI